MKKINLLSIPLLVLFIFTLFISTAHSDDFSPEYAQRALNPGEDPNMAIKSDGGNPVAIGVYCEGCISNTVQGRLNEDKYVRGKIPAAGAPDTTPSSSGNPNGTR